LTKLKSIITIIKKEKRAEALISSVVFYVVEIYLLRWDKSQIFV